MTTTDTGRRVLPYHGAPRNAEHNIYGGTADGMILYTDFKGRARTIPAAHAKVFDIEELFRRDLSAEQGRLAAQVLAAQEAEEAAALLEKARQRVRSELVVTLAERGIPGEMAREPFLELVRSGEARQLGEWGFVVAVPHGGFLPAEHVDSTVWVAGDPVLGAGVKLLVGWRGTTPVAATFHGGTPTVADVAARWTLPLGSEGWRDWLVRAREGGRPDADAARAVLARRLNAGATITPRDSEEAAALGVLAVEGAAVEIQPREFVSS